MRSLRAVWTKRSGKREGNRDRRKRDGGRGRVEGRKSEGGEGGRQEGEKTRRRRDRREREKFYAFISSHIFIIMKR